MKFERKQIWLINFDPSFGHEYRKARPGLIIESTEYIEFGNLLTVIPVSSMIDKRKQLDVLLPKNEINRLMFDSLLKIQHIVSFDKRRFIKYIGVCDDDIISSISKNISSHGVWLLLGDREYFLPYDEFPWFKDVPIGKILKVEEPTPGHLYWSELDIDLCIESIEYSERFPLKAKQQKTKALN
jgi:mRNA interferase MazF